MLFPSAQRSPPSHLRTVTVPQPLLQLGRFLVPFLGAAVCC
jgi:hypothetical protein